MQKWFDNVTKLNILYDLMFQRLFVTLICQNIMRFFLRQNDIYFSFLFMDHLKHRLYDKYIGCMINTSVV